MVHSVAGRMSILKLPRWLKGAAKVENYPFSHDFPIKGSSPLSGLGIWKHKPDR